MLAQAIRFSILSLSQVPRCSRVVVVYRRELRVRIDENACEALVVGKIPFGCCAFVRTPFVRYKICPQVCTFGNESEWILLLLTRRAGMKSLDVRRTRRKVFEATLQASGMVGPHLRMEIPEISSWEGPGRECEDRTPAYPRALAGDDQDLGDLDVFAHLAARNLHTLGTHMDLTSANMDSMVASMIDADAERGNC